MAVLKFIVSQASSAIPVVPLYGSLLLRVMKDAGVHENAIEHIDRRSFAPSCSRAHSGSTTRSVSAWMTSS